LLSTQTKKRPTDNTNEARREGGWKRKSDPKGQAQAEKMNSS